MTTRWLIYLKGNNVPIGVESLHNLKDAWNHARESGESVIHTRNGTYVMEDITGVEQDTREAI